jgi:hypothetical protein
MVNEIVERMVTDGSTGGDARRVEHNRGSARRPPVARLLDVACSAWRWCSSPSPISAPCPWSPSSGASASARGLGAGCWPPGPSTPHGNSTRAALARLNRRVKVLTKTTTIDRLHPREGEDPWLTKPTDARRSRADHGPAGHNGVVPLPRSDDLVRQPRLLRADAAAGVSRALLHLAKPRRETVNPGFGQIARASSSKAAATRRVAASSTPSW